MTDTVGYVQTVAALQAATTTTLPGNGAMVATAGAAPFGGGLFFVQPKSTLAPDGGIVVRDASGRIWVRVCDGDAISPSWYGAAYDGVTDDTAAHQAAINAAATLEFGEVKLCSGSTRITAPLSIPNTVALKGCGITRNVSTTAPVLGTTFICDFPYSAATPYLFNVPGTAAAYLCTFEDFEVFFPGQPVDAPGWVPVTTPGAFYFYRAPYAEVGPAHPRFTNVMIRGMTQGIVSVGVGGMFVDGLYGETFGPLIDLDGMYDVARLLNIHHWPFLSDNSPNIAAWKLANVSAIVFGRVDNPQIDNLFVLGCNTAILCQDSAATPPGGVSLAQIGKIGFDTCCFGIRTTCSTYPTVLTIDQMYCATAPVAGGTIYTGSRSILLEGTQPVTLHLGNAILYGSQLEAVRACVAGTTITASDLVVQSYNQLADAAQPFEAVWLPPGATMTVHQPAINTAAGNGAAAFGGTAPTIVD